MSLSMSRKKRERETAANASHQNEDSAIPSKRRNCHNNNNNDLTNNLSQLSQRRTQQSQRLSNSGYLEDDKRCGKLLSMHLTNFMCHSNLAIDFHSRVNFLVGSNGSGKSAVLAALVLGFGANARATNRSRSAKEFIKNGENSAKIEITLSNDGPQPFEPDVYGDKITVVRTIAQTSGYYTIKNSSGVVVTKKLDDLHRILMYHNVQVDNPVFVLNQDSAREFLKDLEPSKNYKLFLKATQIDVVMEKLNECLHLHKAHLHEITMYKTKLQNQKKEIEEHEKKLEELLSFQNIQENLKQTDIEYHWLLVSQCEEQLKIVEDKLAKYQKKAEEIQNVLQNKEGANLLLTQEIKKNQGIVDEKNNIYKNENSVYGQIKRKVEDIGKLVAESEHTIDSLKKKKSRLEQQIEELKQYIEERSRGNQDDVDAVRQKNEADIQEYSNQCETHLMPMIANIKRELKLCLDTKSQKEQVVGEIKRKQQEFNSLIRQKSNEIANAKGSIKDKLHIYGEHMPMIMRDIEQAMARGKFSEKPRGPVGQYIDVPNSEYRSIVESILNTGQFLKAFIVNNKQDRLILENIFKKYNQDITIVTTRFIHQVYNVNKGSVSSPPQGTTLLINEIVCTDPVVMNSLIDRRSIETILLTKNKSTAEAITSVKENVPHNLSRVICLSDNNNNMALEYYPSPKYRMYSMKINHAKYIQVNVQDVIKRYESEKLKLTQQMQTFEADLQHLQKELPKDAKIIQEKRNLLANQETKYRELQDKISELQNAEYADYSNEIELLKKEMTESEVRLQELDRKLSAKKIELSDNISEKSRSEHELTKQKETLRTIQDEIENIRTESDNIRMKLRNINENETQNKSKLEDLQEKLNKYKTDKAEIVKNLSKTNNVASEKGERIESQLSVDAILAKMAKMKAKLKHGMPVNVDSDTMRDVIATKQDALELNRVTYDNIKMSIDSLRKSLKGRFDFVKKLKEHMALLIQLSFSMILKLRNFEGSLEVNHQDGTLEISVVPRDHNRNAVSNTKALSGGERSYSTVAFLISLWSCVDHPFYFLDEYDVFTDEVNREYMTRLLIDEGRKRPMRQYSFLTPQDMTLEPEDFIKIHRLAEPDRR